MLKAVPFKHRVGGVMHSQILVYPPIHYFNVFNIKNTGRDVQDSLLEILMFLLRDQWERHLVLGMCDSFHPRTTHSIYFVQKQLQAIFTGKFTLSLLSGLRFTKLQF